MTLVDALRARKGLLTVRELAELLSCHQMTLYGWAREGKLPHLRVGARLKFDPVEVAEWLEWRSVG